MVQGDEPQEHRGFLGKPRQKPWENHEKSWANPGILRWYSAGIGQIKVGPRSPMNLGDRPTRHDLLSNNHAGSTPRSGFRGTHAKLMELL
jgi:hypothetical protein